MDNKDIEILRAIGKLGTGSPEKIEEETGIPKSTVHYRLGSLRDEGIVKNDLFDIDLEKVGLDITIISEVQAEYGEEYHDEVGEKLRQIEGVNQIYFTMGETDFIVISNLVNRDMVEGLIEEFEEIDEVVRTNSQFVIKAIKNEDRPLNDFELDTLCNILEE
jgi:DNA-binding Lrp family transcriptional regulator